MAEAELYTKCDHLGPSKDRAAGAPLSEQAVSSAAAARTGMFSQHAGDRALVSRLLARDDAAFAEFFDVMFPRVYRFALARIGQREDAAEDVAQATLCQAVRRLHTWRGEASLLTWILTICRHEIDAWRHAHRWESAVQLVEDVPEIRAALESLHVHELTSAEAGLQRQELAELVQRVLDQLPVHYGNVLEWKYLDETTVRDIAARLAVTEKAAESLLTRARAAFRDLVTSIAPELKPITSRKTPGAVP
jgi:RNA polymerase sigma-70 factor (ECF subfamily)